MKFILKAFAIVYRMYEDRGASIPYFRTIITILLILFLHTVHIGLLVNLPSRWIFPWMDNRGRVIQWAFGILYFGAITLFLVVLCQKRNLEKIEVTQRQIERASKVIPYYLAFCILLLTALLIKSGIEKGTIEI